LTDAVPPKALLAGLNPELAKRVACAWAANQEYEAPEDPVDGGWYAEATELKYRPTGHGDAVARSWIEFAIAAAAEFAADDEQSERALALRDQLLDPKEGVGACIKCHAVSDTTATSADSDGDGLSLQVGWGYPMASSAQRYVKYNHAPHINLLGRDLGCRTCHVVDGKADFAGSFADFNPHSYVSNFRSIAKETCTECHAPGRVRQDCLLCHEYHYEPRFKKQMLAHDVTAEEADHDSTP